MYKVKFNGVEVFTSQTDFEAVQFALSLHQASNLSHTIEVVRSHGPLVVPGSPDEVFCTLFKAEK